MKNLSAPKAVVLLFSTLFVFSACGGRTENPSDASSVSPEVPVSAAGQQNSAQQQVNSNAQNSNSDAPRKPNTQAELLDDRAKQTTSPIGNFDFKNFEYKLPRGWQDADGQDALLENGERRMAEKRIGLSYVATKYGDANGDGADEAFVVLKIVTAGSAIPQIVYVFEWKDEKPELIWSFRTGDRADGGLKNIYADAGEFVVELFGQDRYILGETETMKIEGDEEQLCCPTHFTRTRYKWSGSGFRIQGKRLTFSLKEKDAPPVENKNETVAKQKGGKK